ncbi:MAG TPA: hypothetical protein VJG13_11205 [Thermoanaerobaculia bacterium]|nr:hypothetical protein [Thermoanaerobaculia bacterium]
MAKEKPGNLNVPSEQALAAARRRPTKAAVTRPERCCVNHFWAVVETDGTLVRGRNVVRSTKLPGVGTYEVVFTNDVSGGVYVATIGRPGISTEPAGEIGVALRCCLPPAEANKGVWVDTHDSNGLPSDRAFHLVVHVD